MIRKRLFLKVVFFLLSVNSIYASDSTGTTSPDKGESSSKIVIVQKDETVGKEATAKNETAQRKKEAAEKKAATKKAAAQRRKEAAEKKAAAKKAAAQRKRETAEKKAAFKKEAAQRKEEAARKAKAQKNDAPKVSVTKPEIAQKKEDTVKVNPPEESNMIAPSPSSGADEHKFSEADKDTSSNTDTAFKMNPNFRATVAAECLKKYNIRLACLVDYATDASFVSGPNGMGWVKMLKNDSALNVGVSHLLDGDFYISYGITNNVDIMMTIPFSADFAGWGPSRTVVGDTKVGIKYIASSPEQTDVFCGGGQLSVIFPTGNIENLMFPRDMYYVNTLHTQIGWIDTLLSNKTYINPMLIGSVNFQNMHARLPLELHLNVGSVFTNIKETATIAVAFGLESRITSLLSISLELVSETRPFVSKRPFGTALQNDPIKIIPSLNISLPQGFDILLAGQIGICNGDDKNRSNWYKAGYAYATKTVPFYSVALSIAYERNIARLIGISEEMAGTGFYSNGDRDADSIPDSLDTCVGTPEDRDGFQDADGCPDYDNDNDKIADEVDSCPNDPEDRDGFQDADGCPDYDNDHDGLADSVDVCPDENGLEEYRGCQDVGLFSFTRTVASEISFEAGSSKLIGGFDELDRLYDAMGKNPKSTIEFQVHTDNQGSTAANAELSQSRAETLKLYLVTKGISPGRIKALGLGSEFPIADNSTAEGRKKNQRVEVRRVE